jgi:uncharacterized protein involved in exopolysaccharide biosynthesis
MLRVLFRHKIAVILSFLVITVSGSAILFTMPDQFESEARIYLRANRDDMSIDPAVEGMLSSSRREQSSSAPENEVSILSSRTLHESVAKTVGAERVLRLRPDQTIETMFRKSADPQEAAVRLATRLLGKGFKFSVEGEVINIRYRHADRSVAQDVTGALVSHYIERHVEVHRSSVPPAVLKREVDGVEAAIKAKELDLRQYKEVNDVLSVEELRTQLIARKQQADEAIARNKVAIRAAEASVASLRSSLGNSDSDIPATHIENPQVTTLKERLTELEVERIRIQSQFVGGGELRRINEQVDEIKKKIASLPQSIPRVLRWESYGASDDLAVRLVNEQVSLDALKASQTELEADLEETMAKLATLTDDKHARELEDELTQLRRNRLEVQSAYDRVKFNEMLDREELSNVSVLMPASYPDKPVGPRRGRNFALILFAGLCAGLGLAFVLEFFDDTLKTREDVEKKLGIPVLAVVPVEEFRKCI